MNITIIIGYPHLTEVPGWDMLQPKPVEAAKINLKSPLQFQFLKCTDKEQFKTREGLDDP